MNNYNVKITEIFDNWKKMMLSQSGKETSDKKEDEDE